MGFEDYYKLAFEYLEKNPDQAYICLGYAHMLCQNLEIKAELEKAMVMLEEECNISVKPTSIVIVSYNCCYMLQKNIESIRETLPEGSYVIYVIDNASTDGVDEWLSMQEDIVFVRNEENTGFAPACNQAVSIADEIGDTESDIFLLNNDTRLAPASLFWLKMGLYENDKIGATGSISNYAGNEQQVELAFKLPSDYIEYGKNNNIYLMDPYEERVRLSGFAMLIRRQAYRAVGGMDERFAPGYFEDDDLSVKITGLGYKLLLCKNSFIYHAGSQSFSKRDNINDLLINHRRLFIEKHGFDIISYAKPRYDLISQIKYKKDDAFNVLVVGSGLCADAKYIRGLYKKADVISLEKNAELRNACGSSETVIPDVNTLKLLLDRAVFNVLIFEDGDFKNFTREEIDAIGSVCRSDCQVIRNCNSAGGVDLSLVKLIIWDMDDTFWLGTISEMEVSVSPIMDRLIRDLSYRGIINSISSKNDEKSVMDKLKETGLQDFFVFNNINWLSKGPQIAEKIKAMGLRPENVLFIDDNKRNLQEAVYSCPGIMVSEPHIIPMLAEYVNATGKTDALLKRLKQYQLLEEKTSAKAEYTSGEDFLYDSQIKVHIFTGRENCRNQVDRIADLVGRSNQLNFTKKRSGVEELLGEIDNAGDACGYISCQDKFGDYGIVGFYCLVKGRLEHFLFSCRTLGMGVESAVYEYLNCPEISIQQPVAVELSVEGHAPWVDIIVGKEPDGEDFEIQNRNDNLHILLKGPCDLDTIVTYLPYNNMETEFNYINSKGFVTTGQNHSCHIVETDRCSGSEIRELVSQAPFLIYGDFETELFVKKYDVICYSLLPDCHAGLYKNKKTGLYVSFGSKNFDLTDEKNWQSYIEGSAPNHGFGFDRNILESFRENWEFCGCSSSEMIIENLDYILEHIKGNPLILLLLGSEVEYEGENREFEKHAPHHKRVNEALRMYLEQRGDKNIRLVNATDFIHDQEDFLDSTNHYSRKVYHSLAEKIRIIIDEVFGRIAKDHEQ